MKLGKYTISFHVIFTRIELNPKDYFFFWGGGCHLKTTCLVKLKELLLEVDIQKKVDCEGFVKDNLWTIIVQLEHTIVG